MLKHNNGRPACVVADLSEVFDEVMVINRDKADRSFGFASRQLRFNGADMRQATHEKEDLLCRPKIL
jgi:hypothetical protein